MKKVSLVLFVLTSIFVAGCTSLYNPKPGTMVVVRGSEVRNTKVKQILCDDAGATDVGLDTVKHVYPSADSKRYYLVTTDEGAGDRPGPDEISVETADGVTVGIQGMFKFRTNFTCDKDGKKLVKMFDTQFGSRKFPLLGGKTGTDSGPSAPPWKGAAGWGAFLDINVRRDGIDPVVKDTVEAYSCAELSAVCAAMSNAQRGETAMASTEQGRKASKIQEEIEESIVVALNKKLADNMMPTDWNGKPYLVFTSFEIQRVTLPQSVTSAVTSARKSFAEVAEQRGKLEKAKIEAQTKRFESQQYSSEQRLQLEIARALAAGRATVYYNLQTTPVTEVG